ncbi:hypothetical protein L6164_002530 [Bauhinia variegata]|nr:hypothetical protein L6164_002530 [Bauhinia variegata]
MFFVKDLGLKAQNIARRKLPGCEIRTAASPVSRRPETLNTVTASMPQNPLNGFSGYPNSMRSPKERVDVEIISEGKTAYINDDIDHARVDWTLNADKKNAFSSLGEKMRDSQGTSFGYNEVYKNWSHSYHSVASVEDLSCSVDPSKEIDNNSMILSLDKTKSINQVQLSESAVKHSQTVVLEPRLESKCMFRSQSWALQPRDVSSSIQDKTQMEKPSFNSPRGDFETMAVQHPTREVSCSFEAGNILKSKQTLPLASSFIFNLPYLKTRLDQMKSSEHYRLSELDSGYNKKPAESLDP